MASQWHSWFTKPITTADDARQVIRDSAMAFYTLAGLQAAISLVLGSGYLTDAALYAGVAYWLHWRSSRVAAILLLVISVSVVVTGLNMIGGGGGRNIVLAVLAAWISLRAVQATFLLDDNKDDLNGGSA